MNAFAHAWPRRAAPRRSFAEVAEAHLDGVHRYLLLLTADSVLAEDLAAETFEKALRSRPRRRAGSAGRRARQSTFSGE